MYNEEFVDIIQEAIQNNKDPEQFRLGTITSTNSNGSQVRFDGHDTALTKRFKHIRTYIPVVGNRVLLVRTKGTYVILGSIDGTQATNWQNGGTVTGSVTHNGTVTFDNNTFFNSPVSIYGVTTFLNPPITSSTETGYCGIGGGTSNGTNAIATAVNFRLRKNYTPSSISLSVSSSNADVTAFDISQNGFWLAVLRPSGASTGVFYFWRGTYTA